MITESDGPTNLAVGAILDGELLERVGSAVQGAGWRLWAAMWALNPGTIVVSYNVTSMTNWGVGDSEVHYPSTPAGYNAFAIASPIWSGTPAIVQIQPPGATSTGVVTRDLAGAPINAAYNLLVFIAKV